MVTPIKFGTDGWRAVIAEDFTFDNVRICTQGVADYVQESGQAHMGMVVGYDTRFQSENFAAAVAEVMAANGIKAYLSESAIPTPTTSFTILDRKAAGAVIITASHNPGIWNGFKYRPDYAGSAAPEILAKIESNITRIQSQGGPVKRLDLADGLAQGSIVKIDARTPYLHKLTQFVELEPIKQAGLTVIADSMFGAGIGYLSALLAGGKTNVIEINDHRNPIFPGMHNPEPIDHNLTALKKAIAEHRADVGVANDGDADRVGLMDENSVFINQLQVYALLMLYMLEIRKMRGPVVKTVTTTVMADKLAKKYGIPVYETQVGFKYVGPKMLEVNAMMGGEESGGFAFAGHVPERDGILADLYLLDFMVQTGKKPSELIDYLYSIVGPHYYERWDRVFPTEDRDLVRERVRSENPKVVAGMKVTGQDTKDGFRYWLEDGGWLLIRFSGTEPIIRVYTETTRKEKVDDILNAGLQLAGLK